jgi:hypothetical protein
MKQGLFKFLVLFIFGTFCTIILALLLAIENFIYNF